MAAASAHIVHVTTVPDSLLFLRGQVRRMAGEGIRLSFISSPGPELEAFGREEGAVVVGVPMPRRIAPTEDLRALVALVAALRRLRPDLVHAHTPKGGLLGTLAALLAGVPHRVYHLRGLPLLGLEGWRRALLTATEWVSCHAATHVIAVGPSLREEALRLRLVEAGRVEVLGHGSGQGVDLARFDPAAVDGAAVRRELGLDADAPVAAFVGRLVGDKGIRELVEAWRSRDRSLGAARLLLVGKYEARDPVPEPVRRAIEDDPSILHLGFRRDLPGLYAASDVVVLPTRREGFPNVPLEAMAMGKPVITTDAIGARDAVRDGETGICVPVGEVAPLRLALEGYLGAPARAAADGAAGRDWVERCFRREDVLEHLARRYRSLLEGEGTER
jgi:glycosyltransferase involved in cell wall biosynthesis